MTPVPERPQPLSERLKQLQADQARAPLPDFDLDAVVRGARRRHARRTAGALVGAAAAVALLVTGVALNPFAPRDGDARETVRPASSPSASSSAPATASPTSTDASLEGTTVTGEMTSITTTTPRGTAITLLLHRCDDALSQQVEAQAFASQQVLCLVAGSDPGGAAGPYENGPSTGQTKEAELSPDVVVIGGMRMGDFLHQPQVLDEDGQPLNWGQQPLGARHVTLTQLRSYLESASSAGSMWQLTYGPGGKVIQVAEVFTDL